MEKIKVKDWKLDEGREAMQTAIQFILQKENSTNHRENGTGEPANAILPFMDRLYRTALIITGSPRLAKRLLQEVCLQAHSGVRHFANAAGIDLNRFCGIT